LPLIQAYNPASFSERGVAVPFTTPLLVGARVRPAERAGTELVVPNPSGGRGVYILPWRSVRQICHPTVHDTRLYEKIGGLPALTPAGIRQAARAVAADGFAGRAAQAAISSAAEADRDEQLLANFLLLMRLVEQVEPGSIGDAAGLVPTMALEQKAKRVVAMVAPTLGCSPENIATALEGLAELFGPVGVPPQEVSARLPRLLQALDAVRTDTANWAAGEVDDVMASLARAVSGAASQIIDQAAEALRDARRLALDVAGLLRGWLRDPAPLAARIGRAEWLLDGWEPVILLWRDAGQLAGRPAALLEMAQLVPAVPQEAMRPADARPDGTARPMECRVVNMQEGWRTGTASFGLVARNERMRAGRT